MKLRKKDKVIMITILKKLYSKLVEVIQEEESKKTVPSIQYSLVMDLLVL